MEATDRTWSQWAASRPARHWVGEGVILAALCCFAVSAYLNARYAGSLSQDVDMQMAMKGAGIAMATLLALLAIGKHTIDGNRYKGIRFKAMILMGVLAVAEVWAAMGSIVTNRSDMVGTRKIESQAVANAQEDRPRLAEELSKIKSRQTPEQVEAKIAAWKSSNRATMEATKNCTTDLPKARGGVCDRLKALDAELSVAKRRATIEAQLSNATSAVQNAKGGAGNVADPQSAAMASTLGFFGILTSPDTIGLLAPLGIALALFLAGWWGTEIGFVIRGIAIEAEAQPTAAIVPFKAPNIGTAHVGPTSGPLIPANFKATG